MSPIVNARSWTTRTRLMLIATAICWSSLLVVGAAITLHERALRRAAMVQDLTVLAEVVGRSATASLVFEDEEAAARVLRHLSAHPRIVEGRLYDAKGKPFADYRRDPRRVSLAPASAAPPGHRFLSAWFESSTSIAHDDAPVGSLSVISDLEALSAGSRRSAIVLGLVLGGSALFAFFLISRAQKLISKPILELAEAASEIGRGNFSLRVPRSSEDEIGPLERAFNRMAEDLEATTVTKDYVDRILESMADSLIVAGPERRIQRVNRAACELLGYREDELLSQPLSTIFRGGDEAARPDLDEVFEKGTVRAQEAMYRTKGGVLAPVAFSAALLSDARRRGRGEVVIVARDVSERKEVERRLVEAREAAVEAGRLKSEFLANMSHEIRTPLHGVIGMTDLLLDSELTREQRDYLETIKASSGALQSVIDDILDFSKMEAGGLEFESIPFPLRECVREALRVVAGRAQEKGLELKLEQSSELPNDVIGDPARLRQVIVNLVDNAIKFTERGEVSLKLWPEGDGKLHFVVSDTGIGIPADKQERIFDAFRQADGSTTRRFGGTGLGLAICSRLVSGMGGRIWVESELGRGARFHFILKVHAQPADAGPPCASRLPGMESGGRVEPSPATAHSTHEAGTTLRVLLAEDNPVNRIVALKNLEKRGHRVTAVENGLEAVQAYAENEFDVVLMDLQMPILDGLEATRRIHERQAAEGRRVPIIALTAHAMKGDRERCLEAGMSDYVTKPFKTDELIRVVEESYSPPGSEISVAPALNRLALLERVDGDTELACQLVKVYEEEVPALLGAIRDGLARLDSQAVARAIHRLRGTLSTLGAEAAVVPATRLELFSRDGNIDRAAHVFAQLEDELVRLDSELADFVEATAAVARDVAIDDCA